MTRTRLVLALALAAPFAAQAGDKEAQEALNAAKAAWSTGKPEEVLGLFDKAEAAKPEAKVLRYDIQLSKGLYLQAKTSDLEAALKIYDGIIKDLVGLKDDESVLKQIKSQAMANKASLIYSHKQDEEGAFALYKSAAMLYPSSKISEGASQFFFRLGRDTSRRDEAKRKEILELGLKCAEEAVKFCENDVPAEKRPPALAKLQLQVAIMQHANGKAEEAQKTWAAIDKAVLQPFSLYQQAVWFALQGSIDDATRCLKEFMQKTRPEGSAGIKSRNQLRKFIAGEPDFKQHLSRPDWKDLATDESELGGK